MQRVQGKAFLTIETSPANFQAWVMVEGGDSIFPKRVKAAIALTFAPVVLAGLGAVAGGLTLSSHLCNHCSTVSVLSLVRNAGGSYCLADEFSVLELLSDRGLGSATQ